MPRIVVMGAGAFGTALAITLSKHQTPVILQTRRDDHAADLSHDRENKRYLPGISFPKTLDISCDPAIFKDTDILVIATPTQHTPDILRSFAPLIPSSCRLVIACKGILQKDTHTTPFVSTWIEKNLPNHYFVLSGPNFAHEIAKGLPAAATLAGKNSASTLDLCHHLRHDYWRLYPSCDVVGVSLSGAIKNVYAIASGICHGLSLGQNAMAALVTRSLAEMKRLGLVMGATVDTFMGLSGIGDLMLSCQSTQSRNMSLGVSLANGQALESILASRHSIAEGVYTTKALMDLIEPLAIRMPIARSVHQILYDGASIPAVIHGLLHQDPQPVWECE